MDSDNLITIAFVLFTYNQEDYVDDAVLGALSQTYSPLEILISDDCSTDLTFQRAQKAVERYSGPHKVRCVQTPTNLGLLGNINYILSQTAAEIIVMAAGDDFSLPNRVAIIADIFSSASNTMAVCSKWMANIGCNNSVHLPHEPSFKAGIWRVPVFDIMRGGGGVHTGATYAYRRKCLTWPEPLPLTLANEDRILPLRAATLGEVYYYDAPLVRYRVAHNLDKKTNTARQIALLREDHVEYIAETLKKAVEEQKISEWRSKLLFSILKAQLYVRRTGAVGGEAVDQKYGVSLVAGHVVRLALGVLRRVQRRGVPLPQSQDDSF